MVQLREPRSILLQDELENVQQMAARFVTGSYTAFETWSMAGILEQLKWGRKDRRLIMLYNGLKGTASMPTPSNRRTRNNHSLIFQTPLAGTAIYKSSFYPRL